MSNFADTLARDFIWVRDSRTTKALTKHCFELFGVECGPGWNHLIWEVCRGVDERWKDFEVPPFISQIKEKYGTMCFYIDYGNDYVYDLTAWAEKQSSKVCELCGAPGEMTVHNNWYQTLCPACERSKYAKSNP